MTTYSAFAQEGVLTEKFTDVARAYDLFSEK
jgi:hypothetical protein